MRPPQTSSPQVDWLDGGTVTEASGYRVLRPDGVTDHLLIHSRSGAGRFGSRGAEDLPAAPGSVTLLTPGTPHDYGIADGQDRWVLGFCHFHPRLDWLPLLDWPQERPGVGRLVVSGDIGARVTAALDAAGFYSRSTRPRARLFGMNALEQVLLWCDSQNTGAHRVEERIVRVLEHVERHLADPLDVAGLARVAHLSPSRFAHLFTEQLGVTPTAYVEGQRLTLARQLLEQTARPVAAVAAAAGYTDPLYFSTRFRRRFGEPPTVYRRSRGSSG